MTQALLQWKPSEKGFLFKFYILPIEEAQAYSKIAKGVSEFVLKKFGIEYKVYDANEDPNLRDKIARKLFDLPSIYSYLLQLLTEPSIIKPPYITTV